MNRETPEQNTGGENALLKRTKEELASELGLEKPEISAEDNDAVESIKKQLAEGYTWEEALGKLRQAGLTGLSDGQKTNFQKALSRRVNLLAEAEAKRLVAEGEASTKELTIRGHLLEQGRNTTLHLSSDLIISDERLKEMIENVTPDFFGGGGGEERLKKLNMYRMLFLKGAGVVAMTCEDTLKGSSSIPYEVYQAIGRAVYRVNDPDQLVPPKLASFANGYANNGWARQMLKDYLGE